MVPLPLPLVGVVAVIHPGPVSVVQAHPAGALIPKDTGPPDEVTAVPGLLSENVQPTPD